ncbi:hypothetical protein [Actinomadura sp. WMMB 499]|uniref:hypothetical protein n=1 Tax=Actinomadura sp. WMMB 499 TaxID=1219491 RepID=UPI0012463796|nr:hypothetical protein [Actinomadura sp. WMMB 499]QFG25868.1 hypothetical protein F7P10_36715 [Actinomadura sp. WMMB 499]
MADNWVESTDRDLRRWADERGEKLDEQGTRILLELMRDELGLPGPGELTPERLRSLLLEVFPEAVVAAADDVPTVLAALRGVVGYLRDSGTVTAPDAAALESEIDRVAPEFTEIVGDFDDAEQRAAAEVVAGLMQADGVPMEDREAVENWVREFESLPENERFARTEEYLREVEERVVPPVRIAPDGELAAAARASRLTAAVVALAEWTGERALTEHETLTGADAAEARRVLGLAEAGPAGEPDGELERLWWAAAAAEVIEVEGGRAAPGPALAGLRSGDDGEVLAAWLPLFDAVAVPEHDYEDGLDAAELVQNALTGVLIHLYEQEEPTPPDALVAAMIDHIGEQYVVAEEGAAMSRLLADAFRRELDVLAGWGIVAPAGDEAAGDGRALTPLAVWAVRELLVADGFLAPVVGDLADASAAELVAGLAWHRPDTAVEEIDGWLAGRDAAAGAAELLDVMRTGGPGARNIAATVLHRIGADAAPVVRAAGDHPLVAPYAAMWLASAGDAAGRELTRDEYLWVFVDTVAGMLEAADAAEAVAAALADVPPETDMAAMADELWRIEHPDLVEVLEALGDHHPDRAVAKTARTAAYKARSA